MKKIFRFAGWISLVMGLLLSLLGALSWPPGGLMFALPYIFLIPGIALVLIGGFLIFLTRFKKRTPGIRIVMLLALFWGSLELLHADLGNPDLQALCRVTLKDGTVIDGAILAAKGGYQRYWDVNGFYITEKHVGVTSDFKLPVFFDFDFLALEPWTGHRYLANGSIGGFNYQGRNPVVYFLEDITYRELYVNETKIAENIQPEKQGAAVVLHRTITTSNIYLLHESIPVFTEIPDRVYLNEIVSESLSYYMELAPAKVKRIPVRDIGKFELLHEPPQDWLQAIAAKTARLQKALAKCEECEYLFPVWYHEIVKTPEEYRRLFKPWAAN